MSCRRIQPLVGLWVGGDLAPRRARRVEAHIANCEACRLLADRLRASRAALAALADEAPDHATLRLVRQRVLASLDNAPGGGAPRHALSWFPIAGRRLVLGAALLAVIAAVVVLVERAAHGPETPRVAAVQPTAPPSEVMSPSAPPQRPEAAPPAVRQRVASGVPGGRPQRRARLRPVSPPAREAAAEAFVIKIVTDDPEVVIYWLVDGKRG